MGNVIKLIGIARNTSNGIEAGVYPMMIDKKHPLATVRDSFNAVLYTEMQLGIPCSMEEEQENCRPQVQLSEM